MREHLMIDLETMGLRPNAAIVAIGAVFFDQSNLYEEFYRAIRLDSCTALGLTTDQSTVDWWVKQDPIIRAAWDNDQAVPLLDALSDFTKFVCDHSNAKILRPWGNGADFDLVLMKSAYDAFAADPPWQFYNQRCFRTMKSVFPAPKVPRTEAHHALADAKYQVQTLHTVLKTHCIELR